MTGGITLLIWMVRRQHTVDTYLSLFAQQTIVRLPFLPVFAEKQRVGLYAGAP